MVSPRQPAASAEGGESEASALLELRGITKRFAGVVALENVDLTLRRGQVLALLGENGAGKSTLMKILSGAHRPDAGVMRLDGREIRLHGPGEAQALGIGIIHQEFSLVPHLSVVENIFLGRERTGRFGLRARGAMRREARAVLDRLGATLPLHAPVAQLSVAEQQFVEIAKALVRENRILIMDEPTATLTASETERLFQVMRDLKAAGVALIFISHHLEEISAIADDILCLRDGRAVGEQPVAGSTPEALIRLMVGREVDQTFPPRATVPRAEGAGLEVRCLQRKPHLPEISFAVQPGEVLGVAGLVGSGRTKMVRTLIGAERASRHEVYFKGERLRVSSPADARRAGLGLVPEDRKQQGLVLDANAAENILLTNLRKVCHPFWRIVDRGAARNVTLEYLRMLAVKASARQPVRTLSGGNQQKVVFAKWLNADCEVLILDEPTRGIDVGAKAEIYRLIRQLSERGIAIIMISSELSEVVCLSDRVMVMRRQRIARIFEPGEPVSAEAIMTYATGGGTRAGGS